jgi:hypothetical protein
VLLVHRILDIFSVFSMFAVGESYSDSPGLDMFRCGCIYILAILPFVFAVHVKSFPVRLLSNISRQGGVLM